MQVTPETPIGTSEAIEMLGISKDTLIRMAARGEVTPLHKMPGPNGAYVFDRAEIERLVAQRAAKSA